MLKQLKYIFWQLFGMAVFLIAGAVGGYIYFVGEQKNAAKQETGIEKPITLTPVETVDIEGPEPISQPITNAEKLAKVKAKAKSRPASKPVKPVAYSAPKKPEVEPVENPTTATSKRMPAAKTPAKKSNTAPAAQKPVALSKNQIRNMAINSADRMDYSAPEFRAGLKDVVGDMPWEQTKEVAFAKLQTKSAAIEENDAWSMEKKRAAAEAIKKEQSEKSALQKFFKF